MREDNIKPIPKYILQRIKQTDKKECQMPSGHVRYYSYLTKNDGELVKVTVAVKNRFKEWHYKQCAVHGIHSDKCFLKDMCFCYMGGYQVGWYEQGLQKYRKWYEHDSWGWNDDKLFDPYAPIVNIEYLIKFPKYQYSAWQLYNGTSIIKYLRLYEQYPQIEYLMKLGLTQLYDSVTVLRLIGKDKNFCKWLIKYKDELIRQHHYVNVIIRSYKTGRPLQELQDYQVAKTKLQHDDSLKPIKELFKGSDLERFFSYIAKQNTNPYAYLDYLRACNHLGLDMTINKNLFPRDFKRWHDIRIDEYATAKALQDEEERITLYKQFAAIAEKYLSLEYDKRHSFAVILARSPADLIREGNILQHCVGQMNYDQRIIREESLIFFIRHKESVDTPFVTVEYSLKNMKVLQCFGEKDSKPDEQVLHYVNKIWLPYANRIIKKLAA